MPKARAETIEKRIAAARMRMIWTVIAAFGLSDAGLQ